INGAGYDALFQSGLNNQPPAGGPYDYSSFGSSGPYNELRALIVGDDAYAALRVALGSGSIPPSAYRGTQLVTTFPHDYRIYAAPTVSGWDNFSLGAYSVNAPYLGFGNPVLRAEFYGKRAASYDDTFFTGQVFANPQTLAQSASFIGSFGLDDL